jgi:hypothetical protein
MSDYEMIASGFRKHAAKIKSMSEGRSPQARAQLEAIAEQYEIHASDLLARSKVPATGQRPRQGSVNGHSLGA